MRSLSRSRRSSGVAGSSSASSTATAAALFLACSDEVREPYAFLQDFLVNLLGTPAIPTVAKLALEFGAILFQLELRLIELKCRSHSSSRRGGSGTFVPLSP